MAEVGDVDKTKKKKTKKHPYDGMGAFSRSLFAPANALLFITSDIN